MSLKVVVPAVDNHSGRWSEHPEVAMQLTELQVERSLEALRSAPEQPDGGGCPPGDRGEVPTGLVPLLVGAPAVRADRLAEVRRRLATGEEPTPEAVARRIVGRFVCDRLR
jgi:hypothetical protein